MITGVTNSVPLNQTKHQPGGAPKWRTLLYARGLTDAAIERAGLRPDDRGRGWLFAYAPDGQARRWKAYPSQRGPKSRWHPKKPADARLYDPRGDLAAHIAAAGGDLILAEGEPDVWACWSAGIFNVTATMHGAGTITPWLVDELRRLAVRRLLVWPDRDSAGVFGAAKLRAALVDTGIRFEARELPAALGDKGDINALLLRVGADQLVAVLKACPALDLPTVQPVTPLRAERAYNPPPSESSDLYERWCLEVEQAAIRAWQIAPPNAKNLSRRNFRSPYREDRRPSAQWNYTAHGFTDYAAGEFTNTKQVAELLGLEPWEQWRDRNRPALSGNHYQMAEDAPVDDDALHYLHGFPYTLARTLLTVRQKTVDRADLAPLAVVEHLLTVCQAPDRVTVSDLARRAADQGWPVDRRVLSQGVEQGRAADMYKFFPIAQEDSNNREKIVHIRPLRERLAALGDYLAPRLTAPRHAPALAGEIAAVLGQPAEGLDALDTARAAALAAAAADREQHARRAARWLAYWRANVDRVLAGTYQPLELNPQPLSAPKLRVALARTLIAEDIELNRIVAVTGLSRPSARALAREMGFESVPQTATIPADQVSQAVRARGLVLQEQGGQATICRPNVLKPIDKLAEAERRAVGEQQARQRGLAHRRPQRPQDAQEARWRRQDVRHQQTDERAAAALAGLHAPEHRRPRRDRLDLWLDHQWELAPPLSPPPIDPETGEVYRGRARWLAAFEIVRGGAMSFALFSEPREREHEQEAAPPRPDATEIRASVPAHAVGGAGESQDARADRSRPASAAGGLPGAFGAGSGALRTGEPGQASERALPHGDRDAGQFGIGAGQPADRNRSCSSVGASAGDHRARAGGGVEPPVIVSYIGGMPYTAAMLERRARRLAAQAAIPSDRPGLSGAI